MAATRDHREFVRNWNERVWRQGNLDVIDDLVADDFVARDPGRPEPVRGPDGVREMVEMVRSAFPDVDVELQDCIVENDRVAVRKSTPHEDAIPPTVDDHLESDRTGRHHGPDRDVERRTIDALTTRT